MEIKQPIQSMEAKQPIQSMEVKQPIQSMEVKQPIKSMEVKQPIHTKRKMHGQEEHWFIDRAQNTQPHHTVQPYAARSTQCCSPEND